jgi:hypothetical protein
MSAETALTAAQVTELHAQVQRLRDQLTQKEVERQVSSFRTFE